MLPTNLRKYISATSSLIICYVTTHASDSYELTGLEIVSYYLEFPYAVFLVKILSIVLFILHNSVELLSVCLFKQITIYYKF
jgi:hypothetical protein